MNTFHAVAISPCSAGFGQYQVSPINSEAWASALDLLAEIAGNVGDVFSLGVDALPPGIEDIRGRIENEPESIHAYFENGGPVYFGIAQISESID
jgi:hypothetical protein